VIGPIAFTSACGAAALFMLAFLCALLREASRTRIRFTKRHKSTSLTPVSIKHPSPRSDRSCTDSQTANSSVILAGPNCRIRRCC
jgi:hypothetical protein